MNILQNLFLFKKSFFCAKKTRRLGFVYFTKMDTNLKRKKMIVFDDVSDMIVGLLAPIALVFVLCVTVAHLLQKYKTTSKYILMLSKFGLLCTITALICVILKHYTPYMGILSCQCDLLWKLSIMFFTTSIYAVKFSYILRVWIYFKASKTNMFLFGNGVPTSIYVLVILMIINWVTCIALCFFQLEGVCYAETNKYGCIHTSKDGILITAIVMITLDVFLFCWYSRVWNKKISKMVKHAPESMRESNAKLVKAFRIQLGLTYAALFLTFFDSCAYLINQHYSINLVFILDNIMVSIYSILHT